MKNEYNVEVRMEPIGSKIARWIENEEDVKESMSSGRSMLVKDRFDNLVFLFENEFAMRWFADKTKILNFIAFYIMKHESTILRFVFLQGKLTLFVEYIHY